MERLASFKNATRSMFPKRPLLADEYQKDILALFSETAGKKSVCFDFGKIYTYSEKNPKLKTWMQEKGFTMFIRASASFNRLLDLILPMLPVEGKPLLIYSMWEGYINRNDTRNENYINLQNRFSEVTQLHTSGHATTDTLRRVCELTNPRLAILPIHRDKETDFSSIGIPSQLQKKIITTSCKLHNDIDFVFL